MIILNIFCLLLCIVICNILLYILIILRPGKKKAVPDALLCDYAHRGLHNEAIPENSLAAFEEACAHGFGIELDVQLSADRQVMVFHDYSLQRMTGRTERLSELTAQVLCDLSLLQTEHAIPTLEEVLKLVDGRVPLLIELKGESTDTALCPKVAALLQNYRGAYCIESFNPLLIASMKKQLPDAFCGLLYTNVCREKKSRSLLNILLTAMIFNVIARPHFIACQYKDRKSLPVLITTRCYRAPTFIWTVRNKEEFEDVHKAGANTIFEQFIP